MKTNYWLVLGTMLATSAVAQVNTNKLPEIPAPVVAAPTVAAVAPATTNTVAAPKKAAPVKHKKKAVAKPVAKTAVAPAEKKSAEPAAPLVAGPATVAVANLNLRGQAGLKGEVVGHAKKGDAITVLAVITLDKHKADEPAAWAKIALPTGTKVWVNSKFVNATNNTVSAKQLNLRGGPSENYSVLGVLEKGATITPVITKGDWIQIETPTNAFAFVSAAFLKQEAPAVVPPVVPVVEPLPVTTNTVPEPQPIISQPPPVVPVVPTPVVPAVETNAAPVVDTNPPPPRVVSPRVAPLPAVLLSVRCSAIVSVPFQLGLRSSQAIATWIFRGLALSALGSAIRSTPSCSSACTRPASTSAGTRTMRVNEPTGRSRR